MPRFQNDSVVRHTRFGRGQVMMDNGRSVVARFEHGIEECLRTDLELLDGLRERAETTRFDPAVNVVARIREHTVGAVEIADGR